MGDAEETSRIVRVAKQAPVWARVAVPLIVGIVIGSVARLFALVTRS